VDGTDGDTLPAFDTLVAGCCEVENIFGFFQVQFLIVPCV
jgi:hypothetical protein